MILGAAFRGDTDRMLQRVQYENYRWAVDLILQAAWSRYQKAEEILGIRTGFPRPPSPIDFDHGMLQAAHDILAATFRFSFPELRQRVLPFDELSEADRLHREWRRWIREEVEEISSEGSSCRAILRAAVYSRTDPNRDEEGSIESLLVYRYFPGARPEALGYPWGQGWTQSARSSSSESGGGR